LVWVSSASIPGAIAMARSTSALAPGA
jgi:hypothetical protein